MKKYLSYTIVLAIHSLPLAAGTVGGGGPPALTQLESELLQAGTAGLFTDEAGRLGLGVRGEISEEIRLSSDGMLGFKINKDDLKTMSDYSVQTIDTVSLGASGVSRSYQVTAGDVTDELILKDRRQLMRNSIKN
jgi:hypothetical protein